MMTVNEVSKLTGVSIRALQYYDKIGLLHPAEYTEAGYRLYDDTALERLQQILLLLAHIEKRAYRKPYHLRSWTKTGWRNEYGLFCI